MIDFFDVQFEVVEQVVFSFEIEFIQGEFECIQCVLIESLIVYDYYVKGFDYYCCYWVEDNEMVIEFF